MGTSLSQSYPLQWLYELTEIGTLNPVAFQNTHRQEQTQNNIFRYTNLFFILLTERVY